MPSELCKGNSKMLPVLLFVLRKDNHIIKEHINKSLVVLKDPVHHVVEHS